MSEDRGQQGRRQQGGAAACGTAQEARLPMGLEAALRGRAASGSELPRLAGRVQLQVECREQARLWLAQHGGLNFRAVIRRRRAAAVRAARFAALRASIPAAVWRGLGASLAGAVVGYTLLAGQPQQHFAPWLASIGGLSAAMAAILAVAALGASQWTALRGMLRA